MKKEELGRRLAERRKALRVNQRELAELCGISEHALCNLERGVGNPTFDLIGGAVFYVFATISVIGQCTGATEDSGQTTAPATDDCRLSSAPQLLCRQSAVVCRPGANYH